jgi:hypothetical protein
MAPYGSPKPQEASGGTPSDATPAVLGTATAGTSDAYSRGNHAHGLPTALNDALIKGSAGSPVAAVRDVDYLAPTSQREIYRAIGLSLLTGINRAKLEEIFQSFSSLPGSAVAPADWVNAFSGGGSVSNTITGTQSMSRLSTNAGASARADQNTVPYLGHQGTTRWYYAAKFRLPTVADAETKVLHALATPGGNTLGIGFHGPISATHFIAFRDGTFAGGTSIGNLAPVDTNVEHLVEIWNNADNVLKARFDAGTIISATQTAAQADFSLYHICRNGAAGGNRQHDRFWSLLLWEEA